MKKLVAFLLSLVLTFSLGFSLVGCNQSEAQSEASSFVSIDINPSIELTLDQNNKVMSVRGSNEDGQVLLYGEVSLEGMNVEQAVQKITELAVEMGYLSEDNKVVNTSVTSINEETARKIREKVNTKITASVGDFDVEISEEQANSLVRKWNNFTAENPEFADLITVEKFKLAVSASQTGEVSLEQAITLSNEELIKIVSAKHKEMKDTVSREAEKEYVKAKAEFEQMESLLLDTAYTNFYLTKMDNTVWYGAAYQLYNTLAVGLENAAKIVSMKEDVSDIEFWDVDYKTEIEAICNALNVTVDDIYGNDDEPLTLDRIEAFANKQVKKHNSGIDKAALNDALNELESALGGNLSIGSEDVGKLQDIIDKADVLLNGGNYSVGVKNIALINLDETFNTWVADFETYLGQVKGVISDGTITSEELYELAEIAETRAEEMMDIIKADLTKEELKQIEELKKDIQKGMSIHKGQMEDAIKAAIDGAKNDISGIKNNRHPAGGK